MQTLVSSHPTNIYRNSNRSVTAYFYSSDASNEDKIILWDKTSGAMTAPSLDNHSSAVGSSVSLSVTAGDSLVFIIDNVIDWPILQLR